MSADADETTHDAARLIAIDWGTSALRAYLIGDGGKVLAARAEPWGIMQLPAGGFAEAFEGVTNPWLERAPGVRVLASGMIGSAQGWREVPYVPSPAGPVELARALVAAGDARLMIVPGVVQQGEAPNVMRGEETQIVGALASRPDLAGDALFVLPGTHSKWVHVREARIAEFSTFLTGELFAVLSTGSILGRLARDSGVTPSADVAAEAFALGVTAARASALGLAPLLFSARAMVLTGRLAAEASLEYLSGLLIGDEVRCGLAGGARPHVLVGDPALCSRYLAAFALFGIESVATIANAAPAGLWEIAQHAFRAGPTRPRAIA